jgi:hypothetical protein
MKIVTVWTVCRRIRVVAATRIVLKCMFLICYQLSVSLLVVIYVLYVKYVLRILVNVQSCEFIDI